MVTDPTLRLHHILAAIAVIAVIEKYTKNKTFDEFRVDELLRSTVERKLEIISEASRHLPKDTLLQYPDVPWQAVKGIGNVLRHEYHEILPTILWAVVEKDIAPLKIAIKAIEKDLSRRE